MAFEDGEECLGLGLGLGFVKYTRGLGRKRIVISNDSESSSPADPTFSSPLKRQCSEMLLLGFDKSALEALPQDILVRILCHVEHGDLKPLFKVSKTIRDAALIADQWHFAYTTPTKIRAFRTSLDWEDPSQCEEIEAPGAPLRSFRPRISPKRLAEVSTVLFASPDEEQWTLKEEEEAVFSSVEADLQGV